MIKSEELPRASFFDNTALAAYKDCPRRYFLRHVLDWRSEGISTPLVFGLAWHSAMDAAWTLARGLPRSSIPDIARQALDKFLETWEAEGLPRDIPLESIDSYSPRTPMVALEMLNNYLSDRWNIIQTSELLAVEQPFAVPIPGMQGVWYIGRLDKVIRAPGAVCVIEHKTTTEYKREGGFRSSYIDGWYNDSQVKGYQFGGSLFFPDLTQVWVDAALVHSKVHDAFRFVAVQHPFPLLQEWIDDTKIWILRIQQDTQAFKEKGSIAGGIFPKNESQCIGKFGPCPFLDICRTTSRPDLIDSPPDGFIEERWEPFELLGIQKLIEGESNAKR